LITTLSLKAKQISLLSKGNKQVYETAVKAFLLKLRVYEKELTNQYCWTLCLL